MSNEIMDETAELRRDLQRAVRMHDRALETIAQCIALLDRPGSAYDRDAREADLENVVCEVRGVLQREMNRLGLDEQVEVLASRWSEREKKAGLKVQLMKSMAEVARLRSELGLADGDPLTED